MDKSESSNIPVLDSNEKFAYNRGINRMKKVILSGGPGTGKTTLIELLKQAYPSAYFVEEAAAKVIAAELAKERQEPAYEAILPMRDYATFIERVIDQELESEALIPAQSDLVFMDRCLVDDLGYLTYYDIGGPVERVEMLIGSAGYSLAFFCAQLQSFEQTDIRLETPQLAFAIHQALERVYRSSDVPVVDLPAVSPMERLAIVRDTLGSLASEM